MRKFGAISEKPALDVLDDAFALLRRCPAGVIAMYYIGAAPFVLSFLYFWTDMSQSGLAAEHVVDSSLVVAAAFLWCKVWQSVYCVNLLAVAACRRPPRWTWRKLLRLAAVQASIQPSGLFLMPLSALAIVPYGVVCGFYQNVSALALTGEGEALEGGALRREALAQARRWRRQSNVGLAVLLLFGFVVFLNLFSVIILIPMLMKDLLGIETMVSRSVWTMFNTTLVMAAAGLAYLCVDPILKAFYVLRCFHGRAVGTGEDLRIALRSARAGVAGSGHPAGALLREHRALRLHGDAGGPSREVGADQ